MKHLVQFQLADGTTVHCEVDEPESGMRRVSRGETMEKAAKTFNEALAAVKPAAAAALETFRDLNTPDEITLEFGVKLSGSIGAILASVDSEATFKVALKWQNPK